jgi:hypothetical protein
MPDSFQPHGRRAELFQRALQGASVAFHARLEGAFAKQGTAIAVRLLVIDKRAGSINTTVINRATSLIWCPSCPRFHRAVGSRLNWRSWPPPVSPAKTTSTLLGGFRSAAPKLAAAASRSDATGAIPLAYTLRDTIADAEQAVGVYVAYRPQRLIFENAADHPTQLVESAAMASVALPAPAMSPASSQSDPRPCAQPRPA